jgi:hypothetical protein
MQEEGPPTESVAAEVLEGGEKAGKPVEFEAHGSGNRDS